jgi:hypothetical protein
MPGGPKPTRFPYLLETIRSHDSDECLIWPFSLTANGYGQVTFQGKGETAHRVAFLVTHGHWPTPQGQHTCDVPACFNPRHIIEGTPAQNMADKVSRGRANFCKGEKHGNAKLTKEIVFQIRADYPLYGSTITGANHGISRQSVCDIVFGRTWQHV